MKEVTRLLGMAALGMHKEPKVYAQWAQTLLENGTDSPSLRVLAGLDVPRAGDTEEIELYFKRSLAELNIAVPSKRQAIDAYASDITEGIINGTIEPRQGAGLMCRIDEATLGDELRYRVWSILDSNIESEYYDTHLTKDTYEKYIINEAKLFKEYENVIVPDNIMGMVYCPRCGYFGLPARKRVHYSWLPAWVYKLVFLRKAYAAEVCPQCEDWKLRHIYDQESRRKYLEIIRKQTIIAGPVKTENA